MRKLPALESSLLVRTEFTSDDYWRQLCAAASRVNEDGFRAYVDPVSDIGFDSVDWEEVKAALPGDEPATAVLFIDDSTAPTDASHPVLVVDLLDGNEPFRCVLPELWNVENNLNIADMDWADFASASDGGGVSRGFEQ